MNPDTHVGTDQDRGPDSLYVNRESLILGDKVYKSGDKISVAEMGLEAQLLLQMGYLRVTEEQVEPEKPGMFARIKRRLGHHPIA